MKVLVTGGTGFVGSHSVEALCRAGHEVRLFARSPEKVERMRRLRRLDELELRLGDMGDAEAVGRALEGCEAVLHAAANVEIGRAQNVFDTNFQGSRTVSELGVGFRPVRETLRDSLRWLLEVGEIDPQAAPALARLSDGA